MSKVMRAYVLSDASESCEYQEIVFAESAQDAKRGGSDVWSSCDFTDRRAKRAPEFDDASNPPTKEEYLARGWWFACGWCDSHVSNDTEGRVMVGEALYCNQECADNRAELDAGYALRRSAILVEQHETYGGIG